MYESEVAEPPERVLTAPRVFHVVPLSVEYWNVTVPVDVPAEPVMVTEAVTEPPRVMGLGRVRVGAGTVGVASWIAAKFAVMVPSPLIVAVVDAALASVTAIEPVAVHEVK